MSLFDYRVAPTAADFRRKFGELLQLASIPVFSWSPFAWLRRVIEDESTLFEDLAKLVRMVALSRFRHLSKELLGEDDANAWLDLEAENFYDELRKPAVFTRGIVRFTDSGEVGPIPIDDPRVVWVGDELGTYRYVNRAPFTIPLSGFVDVEVEADEAGEKYNLPNGGVTSLQTDLLGVTVQTQSQENGTWITQQGTDAESFDAFNARLDDKWSTLGSGADDAGYRFRALSSSPEVKRCKVYSPAGGQVRIVVAGASGVVSADAFALAVAANTGKVLGVPDVETSNPALLNTVVQATLEVLPGTDPAVAKAAALAAVQTYARSLPVGPRKVSRERIIRALSVDGVDDLTLTSPAADFVPLPNELWVPSFNVVVVTVNT